MPVTAGPPLKKITTNLYHEDVIKLKTRFGDGWSVYLRDIVHDALHEPKPRTVADYVTEDLDDA